ncbi:RHS repeat-associated core domain-containing protein [Cellulomonas sp. 179-A 9B4 NHS]|uniref:RHS repeat-associated core domain-containing protein n=1 Tax=Cellulomonas sp. 179-A 9B4 NHS TaxID=3142379 RepID=UPI00399F3B72
MTARLSDRAGGGWELVNTQGARMSFDAMGRLTADLDEYGRGVTATYSAGRLASLRDELGQTLQVTWGGTGPAEARITKVTASDGRTVGYEYADTAGAARLVAVVAPDGARTSYTYDAATGLLNGITDPLGKTTARTTYDPESRRVVEQEDATGAVTTFAWDAASQTATITDPLGRVRHDVYQDNVLISQVDGDGADISTYYGQNNQPVAVQTTGESLIENQYDERGNLTERTERAGPGGEVLRRESWSYDAANRITTHTDPAGGVTRYVYDAHGQTLAETDPTGATVGYTYTALGQVATVTDPLGRVTTNTYDSAGDLVKVTDADGSVTAFTYDAAHRRLSHTTPRGSTTRYTYDAEGRLLTETDPLGRITTYEYDAAGQLTSMKAADGASTTYTYDALGRQVTATDALVRTTTTTYDDAGQVTAITGPDGGRTTRTYDRAGRLTSQTEPLGNDDGADADTKRAHTTWFAYDSAGRRVQTQRVNPADPDTKLTWSTTYDGLGQPVVETDPAGAQVRSAYDAAGNVISQTDATGVTTTKTYDAVGRVTSTTSGGKTTTNQYDAAGQRVRTETRAGAATFTYTADGQVASIVDSTGAATSYTYDSDGNQTAITDPLGRTTQTTYDAAGQATVVTDAAGRKTTTAFDAVGRVKTVTTPSGGVTAFAYDAMGQVSKITGPHGRGPSYTYDAAGRTLTAATNQGRATTFTYDLNGNETSRRVPSGGTVTTTYDTLNRPVKVDHSDNSADLTFTYDAVGRPTAVTQSGSATGAVQREYDPAGRTTAITSGGATTTYRWDPEGRLQQRVLPDERTQTYGYDDDARVASTTLTSPGAPAASVQFGWNANDRLTSVTRDDGPVSTLEYDAAGQLTGLAHAHQGEAIVDHDVAYDVVGQLSSIVTQRSGSSGESTTTSLYTYDSDGRLTQMCQPAAESSCGATDASTTFQYDKAGNRTSRAVANRPGSGTTTYTYDGDDRLTKEVTGASTTTYTYDSNGNLIKQVSPSGTRSYTYGLDANLAKAVLEDGRTYTYGYDAAGNRTSRHLNGTVEATWTWDLLGDLPVRTGEADAAGTAVHQWWVDPVTRQGSALADSVPYAAGDVLTWLLTDPTNSVTDTATSAGLTGSVNLDPFGALISGGDQGYADNPLRFHGQYLDSATGLYDMRARDYDPENGRFTSVDPASPKVGGAYQQTYHYALNRPTQLVDPNGEWAWLAVAAVGAVAGVAVYGAEVLLTDKDWNWKHAARDAGIGAVGGLAGRAVSLALKIPAVATAVGHAVRFTSSVGARLTSTAVGAATTAAVAGARSTVAAGARSLAQKAWSRVGNGRVPQASTTRAPSPPALSQRVHTQGPGAGAERSAVAPPVGANGKTGLVDCPPGSQTATSTGTPASVAVGRRGATKTFDEGTTVTSYGFPTPVTPGTNAPATIAGRQYSGHALDRMQERGLTPSVVEDAITHGVRSPGNDGATVFESVKNGVTAVVNDVGRVITAW